MSRLDIKSPSRAETVVENLYRDVERRIAASPPGLCPVDMALSFLRLCHAQSRSEEHTSELQSRI